jgi:hypothetical protein
MRTLFYAIDESECRKTDTVSATGVLVPIEDYQEVASRIYQFFKVRAAPNSVNAFPPELHGSNLLRENSEFWAWTDDDRIDCFETFAALVNDLRLQVRRIAYEKSSFEPIGMFAHDPKALQFNVSNLLRMAAVDGSYLVPVIDGLEKWCEGISGQGTAVTRMVAHGLGASISLPFPERICEPFFTSSRHSPLIQIADMVGYLLHVQEWKACGQVCSPFKDRVAVVAESLDKSLIRNERIRMQHLDKA